MYTYCIIGMVHLAILCALFMSMFNNKELYDKIICEVGKDAIKPFGLIIHLLLFALLWPAFDVALAYLLINEGNDL